MYVKYFRQSAYRVSDKIVPRLIEFLVIFLLRIQLKELLFLCGCVRVCFS